MDVVSTLYGQAFVWDSKKAGRNVLLHGIRFEQAREAFLDPLARYEDASVPEEAQQACLGLVADYRLLFVVPRDSRKECAPHHLRASGGDGGKETL